MSLETTIAALTAAIEENTRTMRELAAGTTAPVKPTKAKAEKPAPAVVTEPEPAVVEEAPVTEESSAPEPESTDPVVEEPAETEAPAPAADGDDYDSWDEPKLRLAIQEFCKTKLISPDSAAFKAKFGPELAKHGVEKAAKLPADKLAEFYRAALTW